MAKADPKKPYYNKVDRQWYKPDALATEGTYPGFRKMTKEEMGRADVGPLNVVPGQGVGLAKRWAITSFANNADDLKEWLGTDPNVIVRKTGGGRPHDLGVSTDGGETFKLIDPAPVRFMPRKGADARPAGMIDKITLAAAKGAVRAAEYIAAPVTDPAEFGRDILDISVDVLQAMAVSAATVGGGVTAPLTGAMAGYASEDLRQRVGVGMGMNKEVDQLQSAIYGGATAAPQLGKSVISLARSAKPAMMEMGAKLVGAKADTQITDTAILAARIRDTARAGGLVADVEKEGADIRRMLATVFEDDFPEKAITTRMEGESKGFVDMTRELKPLAEKTRRDLAGPKTVENTQSLDAGGQAFVDTDMPEKATDTINSVYGMLKLAGVDDPTRAPIPVAAFVKDRMWETAKDAKVFNGREVSVPFKKELRDLGGRISDSIRREVDQLGPDPGTNQTYSQLMDSMHDKSKQVEYWQQAAGVWEWAVDPVTGNPTADKRYLDAIAGNKKMVGTIRNFWGDSHHGIVSMLNQLRTKFGLDVAAKMERAAMSTMIGKEGTGGAMGLFPQLAASGGFKLAGTIGSIGGLGGLGAYAATGDPVTALGVGAISALAPAIASSPRMIVGAAKTLGPKMVKLAGGVEQATGRIMPKTVINLSTTQAIREFERQSNERPSP